VTLRFAHPSRCAPSADVSKETTEALAELRATVAAVSAAVARRAIVRPMSNVSRSDMDRIREAMGVFLDSEQSEFSPVACEPFNWRPPSASGESHKADISENEAAEGVLRKEQHLASGSLLDALRGTMPADLAPRGFLFADVRSVKLSLRMKSQELDAQLSGKSDAAVAHALAALDVPHTCVQLSCALVDWNTPAAMACDAAVEAQLLAQLLALATSTRRRTPAMIAATDMATRFRVWVLEGRVITEYRSGPRITIMTLEEGLGVFWGLMPRYDDAVARWIAQRKATPLPWLREDDGDGDDDGRERLSDALDAARLSGAGKTSSGGATGETAGGAGADGMAVGAGGTAVSSSPVASITARRRPLARLDDPSAAMYADLQRAETLQVAVALSGLLFPPLAASVAAELREMTP